MKQILKIGILVFTGFFALISSCTKDTFTEEDAFSKQQDLELLKDSLATRQELIRDSLQKMGGIINYSVAAVLASDATWFNTGSKGSAGLSGVVVTIAQHGKIMSATTDASGIASFKDLRIGTVNVNVSKTGYTEVDFVANLPALLDTVFVDAYNIVRHVGTMVPLFSLTTNLSTISGIATVETDLTNNAPEPAANVKIMATIDAGCSYFQDKYIYHPESDIELDCDCEWWSFDYYGVIKQIAIHSVISTATTGTDGSFTMQVPSTPDGLPLLLTANEFAANQSILQATLNNAPVWGVQSIRTLFGNTSLYFSYSSIPEMGTGAGQVQPAYVQFSAPTGTPAAQPTTPATATAVLASSGIASVNITSPGSGYTQAPKVVFSHGTGWNSVLAEGTAVITNGGVTAVNVTSPGTGYLPTETPTVTFSEAVDVTATATPLFSYSLIGFSALGNGSGYTSTAPTVTISGDGTGATAHAVMSGSIVKTNITNPGGYTSEPKVVISDSKGNTDLTATADMSDFAPLASITYVKPATVAPANLYDGPPAAAPAVIISGGGVNASGATATSTLATVGQITGFTINTPGSGYSAANTVVSITLGGSGAQWANAIPTIGAAGAITGITVIEGGFNYTSVPTVTITGDGTGATATAIVKFPISTINLSNGGVNYSTLPANEPAITVGGNLVPAVDIYVKYLMKVEALTIIATTAYETQPAVTFTSVDGFAGTTAAATFDVAWKVGALVVDNEGSGYTYTPNVIISLPPAGGSTASATATLGNGVVKEIIVDQPGMGYTAAPHAEIAIAGVPVNVAQEAQLAASFANGQVTGITVSDAGAGYSYQTTYTVKISTFNTGGAATANPNPKSGQIEFIQVTNPGAGYAVTPVVEIVNSTNPADANGFGKGAAATAVLTDGRVSAITVTNGGSGYYATPSISITIPVSSMTAVGRCTVDGEGKISGVDFTGGYPFTKGYGYNTVPAVTFFPSVTGKGSGATGVAVLKDGRVDNVIMTNQGSGYVGKNNPSSTQNYAVIPDNYYILAKSGKAYIRDIYFGTGKRTIEQ